MEVKPQDDSAMLLAVIADKLGTFPSSLKGYREVIDEFCQSTGLTYLERSSASDLSVAGFYKHKAGYPAFYMSHVDNLYRSLIKGLVKRTPAVSSIADKIIESAMAKKASDSDTVSSANTDKPVSADGIMKESLKIMDGRAKQYDKEGTGERSMEAAIKSFNAITGNSLQPSDGYMLLMLLKLVRNQTVVDGAAAMDCVEDCVAYSALYGESVIKEKALKS